MIRVYLTRSGDGKQFAIGNAESFEEASALVEKLEGDYAAWENSGFPVLPEDDIRAAYEGCDIYADAGEVLYWLNNEDEWEVFE